MQIVMLSNDKCNAKQYRAMLSSKDRPGKWMNQFRQRKKDKIRILELPRATLKSYKEQKRIPSNF